MRWKPHVHGPRLEWPPRSILPSVIYGANHRESETVKIETPAVSVHRRVALADFELALWLRKVVRNPALYSLYLVVSPPENTHRSLVLPATLCKLCKSESLVW
jgi:hypothetical protein